jgi:prefoldin subunit 2
MGEESHGIDVEQMLNELLPQSNRAVIETLQETQRTAPERKCFRMIGGVLVERNVKEVLPALETNLAGVSCITEEV